MRCIVAVLLEADRLSDVRVRTRGVRWLTSAMGAAWATLRIVTWHRFFLFRNLRKGQLNRHTRYRPATTRYHTKHCHAAVVSLGGLTNLIETDLFMGK